MATLDIIVFVVYGISIISLGLWVSRNKQGKKKNTEDYFLASKSLPWWAIGASLIAANISAEQFIGMSGSGFAIGLGIASYEWMGAITLIIVGKFFLPVFIEKKLYTIPEFVEKRYSANLKTILAIFWIALFIFVNLTSVLYLGAKALGYHHRAGRWTVAGTQYPGISPFCCRIFPMGRIVCRCMDGCSASGFIGNWRIYYNIYCIEPLVSNRGCDRWICTSVSCRSGKVFYDPVEGGDHYSQWQRMHGLICPDCLS